MILSATTPPTQHQGPMKNWRKLNRFQAAGWHLTGSITIAIAVFVLFRFVWYPNGLFNVAAAGKLLLLVVGVDVVIGPLLTLSVFDPAKRLLPFDLMVIVLLQLSALSYGVSVLLQSRPVFLVGVVDRFELVMANEIEADDLAAAADTPYARLSWSGPVLVGTQSPKDPEQRNRLLIESLTGGSDIDRRPAFYQDYRLASAGLRKRARPLSDWVGHTHPGVMAARSYALSHDRSLDQVLVLPLRARMAYAAILLDANSGEPLHSFDFDPYEVLPKPPSGAAEPLASESAEGNPEVAEPKPPAQPGESAD